MVVLHKHNFLVAKNEFSKAKLATITGNGVNGESIVSLMRWLMKPWEVVLMDNVLYVTQFPMQIFTESAIVCITRVQPQLVVLRVDLTFDFLSTSTHYLKQCVASVKQDIINNHIHVCTIFLPSNRVGFSSRYHRTTAMQQSSQLKQEIPLVSPYLLADCYTVNHNDV